MPPKRRTIASTTPAKSPTPGPSTSPSKKRGRAAGVPASVKSPTPGPSTLPLKKRGRIAGIPGKTNKERALESTLEQHLSTNVQRTLTYLGCEDAQETLRGAVDFDDYTSRLPYFFGRIFLVVRDLRQKEREIICKQTLPELARSVESVTLKYKEAFEEAYPVIQFHFLSRIIKYGQQWIKSKAGVEFITKSLLAKKRKKPTLCPQPNLPSKPEHMLNFGDHPGIMWETFQAIDFWAPCLCAFETEDLEKKDILRKELDGVALELIRQFAVFESLHPGGYSSTEHVKALCEVMPAASFRNKVNLEDLLTDLGIIAKACGERPAIPNISVNLASRARKSINGSATSSGTRNSEQNHSSPTALQVAELGHIDSSNTRVGNELPAFDDEGPVGYAIYEQEAAKVEGIVRDAFSTAFEKEIAAEPLLADALESIESDDTMLSLHCPRTLTSNLVSQRAEVYAKGNIWVRSLIGAADRQLESRRLNALMMAAQQKLAMLQHESEQARKEVQDLRKKHELLKSAWASVDEAANERDALRMEQRKLEHGLLGGEEIAGSLFGRFQAVGSLGLSAVSKQPTADNKEEGMNLFAPPDTPRHSIAGFQHLRLEESTSVSPSPSISQAVRQVLSRTAHSPVDSVSPANVKSHGPLDSFVSSATSKIAQSQPQSQPTGSAISSVASAEEIEALRNQISDEIDRGKLLDEGDEDDECEDDDEEEVVEGANKDSGRLLITSTKGSPGDQPRPDLLDG